MTAHAVIAVLAPRIAQAALHVAVIRFNPVVAGAPGSLTTMPCHPTIALQFPDRHWIRLGT
jgi:hypothetical protein